MAFTRSFDVASWLAEIGMGDYADAFAANDVDRDVLGDLTADDLREIGVASIGHRRKILSAIAKLSAPVEELASRKDTAASQRRQTTMFFSDLVGFTKLIARLDPEEMHELLGEYKEACAQVIARNQGHLMQFLGDGVLATFGYPRAEGDDAARAVRAGLEIVAEVAKLRTQDGEPLAARVGMATGVVVTGELAGNAAAERDMLVGEAPNLAARLQGEAEPGQVFITGSTAALIGRQFVCESVGARLLKGFADPVPIYRVLEESRIESRFEARLRVGETPLVGRSAELAMLQDRASLAKSGRGQVVMIEGDAGIGKSRLIVEIARLFITGDQDRLLIQSSPQLSGTPFYGVIKLIEYAANILPADGPEARFEKLQVMFDDYDDATDMRLALVARMLNIDAAACRVLDGYDAREIRMRMMEAMLTLMCEAASRGALIVFEDTQWIDPSTRELMDEFIKRSADYPCLTLVTRRTATARDHAPVWLGAPHVSRLLVERLSTPEIRALTQNALGDHATGVDQIEAVVSRSDGVPVFAEELVYALIENAAAPVASKTLASGVPSTLTESLLARLDRLNHGQEVAMFAAVAGPEISLKFLTAIVDMEKAEMLEGLEELTSARILIREETSFGEVIMFRQSLLRDCAYALVLRRDRLRMHARIAKTAIEQFPDIMKWRLDFVPRHLEMAGDTSAAITAWRAAGRNAGAAAAAGEAVAHFSRALALCTGQPESAARDEQEMEIRAELAFPHMAVLGPSKPEVRKNIDRAVSLSQTVAATHRMVPILTAKWMTSLVFGSLDESAQIVEEVVTAAEGGGEIERLLVARLKSTQSLFRGELQPTLTALNEFKSLYDPARHYAELVQKGATHHPVTIDIGFATCLSLTGECDKARVYSDAAIKAAREGRHINTLCQALVAAGGFCAALRRDADALDGYADELGELTSRYDMGFWHHHTDLFKGLSAAYRGDAKGGLPRIEKSVDGIIAIRSIAPTAWLAFYADASIRLGDKAKAAHAVSLAVPFIESGERWFEAETRRVAALCDNDRSSAARQESLTRALKLARAQGAGLIAARAEADLAHHSSPASGTPN